MIDGFLLKKLLSLFVHVIPGVPILLLIALLCRRWLPTLSHALSIALTVVLIALSIPTVSNYFVTRLENQYPPLSEAPVDTGLILVLGYGHNDADDRSPNSVLTAGALSRIMEGVRLWQTRPESTLVVSGAGFPGKMSHAQAMKNMALAAGVPDNSILTFDHTRDTAEEIKSAAIVIEQRTAANNKDRLVVVSSATHLPRAALMLKDHEVIYTMAPTDYLAGDAPWYWASSFALNNFDRALHEWVGMLWHRLSK